MTALTGTAVSQLLGAVRPRLATPPLVTGPPGPCGCGCALTERTSYGFDVAWFAEHVLDEPLDPWQRHVVIHAGELLPDGRPRFRIVLILVARQQGKTHLLRTLSLYWLYIERQELVLGTSTNRDTAKETWEKTVEKAVSIKWFEDETERPRFANGQEQLVAVQRKKQPDGTYKVVKRCVYKIAAANRKGGRGKTTNRLILDELREHHTWDAWNAASHTMNAVPDAQTYALSNQGDDKSVVLDALREPAIVYIETGTGDERLGLFEWSAPDGADPTDPEALAMANPQYGRRTDPDALTGAAQRAKAAGGEEEAAFRTEVLCQRVHSLSPVIDPLQWRALAGEVADLAQHRRSVAVCVDVSLDGTHATLYAAAALGDPPLVHLDPVAAWEGPEATAQLRARLPGILSRLRPRAVGWFPAGPAAAVTAMMGTPANRRSWVPRGTEVIEIVGDTAAVCMGFADIARPGRLIHPDDPLLNAHVSNAIRVWRGDRWLFMRRGAGPIDAVYAAAGAVHIARSLPPAPPPLTVL